MRRLLSTDRSGDALGDYGSRYKLRLVPVGATSALDIDPVAQSYESMMEVLRTI